MKTILPVKILVDLLTDKGDKYDGLLSMTVEIEDGMLTIGSYDGPDMWRGKLLDLQEKEDEDSICSSLLGPVLPSGR